MLSINGLTKQYGSKILFEDATAHIGQRSRVALIGPNGAGKSTLIRLILGHETPDAGNVVRASHLVIGHLAQETPKFSGHTVLSETMRLDGRQEDLIEAKRELETRFEGMSVSEADLDRYGRILEELEHLDEYRLEARAKEILTGMGFKSAAFDRPLTQFSGGWLMRVALSRVLLMDPDLLLLDEPTNHLDLESLLWLEEFLGKYRGAMLLVSHDRAFLNRMVHEVLEIDQRKLWIYHGNLDAYVRQKEERLAILRSQYKGQQAKIAELEAFIDRFGAKATKARQAQSRVKQLEKMERIELPEHRATVRFTFPPAPHSGKEVVTLRKGALSYGEKPVFKNLDWVIQRGSRVAIVGVNGAGKTTLLKLLAGVLPPTAGVASLGHLVAVGYYAQHMAESLDLGKTVFEELREAFPELPTARIRGVAGAFLFSGDAIDKRCSVLSGGEKARVALAKLLLAPSNLLVLDEPTNHLDADSRAILLNALLAFEGTLCLVSHDREFIGPLVTSVLEIVPRENGSEVIPLVGGYDDYLARKMREAARATGRKAEGAGERINKQAAAPRAGPSRNQRRSWERGRDALEAEIAALERRQAELHEQLADTRTYEDKAHGFAVAEELRQLEKTMGEKLARWEELCLLLGAPG